MASVTVSVNPDRLGLVIGPKGATRRAVELAHGVSVAIDSDTGIVTISGSSQKTVDAAAAMVRNYSKDQTTRVTGSIVIPDASRGALIGRGGNSIRALQGLTGTKIHINESVNGQTEVTVEGADQSDVNSGLNTIKGVLAAEALRIALKEGKSVSHVTKKITVPSAANVAAICGREWSYLNQVSLQAGVYIKMERGEVVVLEVFAPTQAAAAAAEVAIAKLIADASAPRAPRPEGSAPRPRAPRRDGPAAAGSSDERKPRDARPRRSPREAQPSA